MQIERFISIHSKFVTHIVEIKNKILTYLYLYLEIDTIRFQVKATRIRNFDSEIQTSILDAHHPSIDITFCIIVEQLI